MMRFFKIAKWKKYQPKGGGSWFRVDAALIHDLKLLQAPASVRYQFVALLALVCEQGNRLPLSNEMIADAIHVPVEEMDLDYLAGVNLITDADTLELVAEDAEPDEEESDDSLDFARRVRDYWNEKVKKPEHPTHISKLRRGHVNARRLEFGDAAVFEAVDKRAASSFMNSSKTVQSFKWMFYSEDNFGKTLEGNYDDAEPKTEEKTRSPKDASNSDFFYADRCCKTRGLDPEDMTQPERIDVLNEDLAIVVKAARAAGVDTRGAVGDLFDWYSKVFGGYPGADE